MPPVLDQRIAYLRITAFVDGIALGAVLVALTVLPAWLGGGDTACAAAAALAGVGLGMYVVTRWMLRRLP